MQTRAKSSYTKQNNAKQHHCNLLSSRKSNSHLTTPVHWLFTQPKTTMLGSDAALLQTMFFAFAQSKKLPKLAFSNIWRLKKSTYYCQGGCRHG
jgi:hypothetical protein